MTFISAQHQPVPSVIFKTRQEGRWVDQSSSDLFAQGRFIVFGLPGAFTPTCSSSHLPRFEQLYPLFQEAGVDGIFCVSVNDAFVMQSWADSLGIRHVQMLPDGNADWTRALGMLVNKSSLGFGDRSWRYALIIQDGVIQEHFIEPDQEGDPFEVSDADTLLHHLHPSVQIPPSITIFSKKDCPFCYEAKTLLQEAGLNFYNFELPDAHRQQALSGLLGLARPTVPQIFIQGQHIGGLDGLKQYLHRSSDSI